MKYTSVSRKGGRERNEDFVGKASADGIGCFVVADGLGGHSGGNIASEAAVTAVIESFNANPEISYEALYSYMISAQNKVIKIKTEYPEYSDMSTTIVILVTDGTKAIWGHIGDSRLYRFHKNLIQEVTDDHSVAFVSFVAGECEYDDIRTSPDQNKLIRTIGNPDKFMPQIYDVAEVDDNTAFLLCTDGFWEYVYEEVMEETLKNAGNTKQWILDMIEELQRNAPSNNDNYTAIGVCIK